MRRAGHRSLAVAQRPFAFSIVEAMLLPAIRGRPYKPPWSWVPPRWSAYRPNSYRSVRRSGFELMLDLSDVVQWYAYWAFASPSHDTLEAICKPGDTAIDVGANVGLTTLRLARGVGPTGRVIALEPSADQLDRCRYHVTANSIAHATLRGKAASDTVGAAHLRALDSGNSGRTVLADSGTPVETTTIDALVAEERLQRVDVVKIDVEGHEARVLHGAEETIRRFLPSMHIEVNDEHLRDSGDTAEMLLDELSALGYRLYDAATGASLGQLARLPPHMDIVAFSARR